MLADNKDLYIYLESWRAIHILSTLYKVRLFLLSNDIDGAWHMLHHIVSIFPDNNEREKLMVELEEIRNLCVPFNGSCNNPEGKRRTLREKKKRLLQLINKLTLTSSFQRQIYRFKPIDEDLHVKGVKA
jgi:hypothetical protein